MSATITVNRECSRCPRTDRREVSLQDVTKLAKSGLEKPKSMEVRMDGETLFEFENLCGVCQQIVENSLAKLCKKLDQRSSIREKKVAPEEAGKG